MWKKTGLISVVVFGACLTPLLFAQNVGDQAKKNNEFYKIRSSVANRSSGALLQTAVSVAAKPGQADEIQIDWTLDYSGPRPPLIILEPSLDQKTAGQTFARFYAEGKDQQVYEFDLKSPEPINFGGFAGNFLTIEKGKSATGKITISARSLASHYRSHWPNQFSEMPAVVHVQLVHQPNRRGNHLDAWTGKLHATVLRVPIKKW